VVDNELSIGGERKAQNVANGTFHRREIETGKFQRFVRLPCPVDADKVDASLVNGVLTVRLPKAESARPKRIAVKSV
jgi:HSP20 family protein